MLPVLTHAVPSRRPSVLCRRLGVHGGAMRIVPRRKAMNDTPAPVVQEMLDEELASGMLDKESYDAFTRRVDDVGTELRQMLKEMKARGLKIAGYGAPAKGNTLLNYFGDRKSTRLNSSH